MNQESLDGPLGPNAQVRHLTVLERLGGGSFGTVYKVRDEQLDTTRALKVLNPHLAKAHRRRLIQEGRALAKLDDNPHVVRILQVIETTEVVGLLLEFVDGPNLAEFMDRHGGPRRQLPMPVVRAVGAGIIRGVIAIHASRHLHRDLKPENVLLALGRGGEITPKVADFGLVKDLRATLSPKHTIPGQAMGTPLYMAPEQWRDAASVDERADIWSLGVLLYELATGVVPFEGERDVDVLTQVFSEQPLPPSRLRPDMPQEMEQAILHALARDRQDRIATASALLDAWLDDSPVTVVRTVSTFDSISPTELTWDELPTVLAVSPDPSLTSQLDASLDDAFVDAPTVVVDAAGFPELAPPPPPATYDSVNIWRKEEIEALLNELEDGESAARPPTESLWTKVQRRYDRLVRHPNVHRYAFYVFMGVIVSQVIAVWAFFQLR